MSEANVSGTDGPSDSAAAQPVFHVEKLYLKDLSFESPNAPDVFRDTAEPKVDFNLETGANQKGPEHYESTLHITVKVLIEGRVMFLVEVVYAGLFLLRNLPKEHIPSMLGIECPNILFPYVRQIISYMVTQGGFKPMVLDPINFAALFHQARDKHQAAQVSGTDTQIN